MKNLDLISEELFNKIRGRFPTVTIGNEEGIVTNKPNEARFFDFDYKEGPKSLGKVSISVDESNLSVMYSNNFVEGQDSITKNKWYDFLKELRFFAKKRLLNFDTRDITKSNLNKRDYKFLAKDSGEETMTESKMYGTSKTSYQDVGTARLAVRHNKAVNQELASGRTQHIDTIYIESAEGERFKYPFKHLNGARAMARHVSEGGKTHDEFGQHITGLSEELYKLKKFKSYMNRSGVMAEGLSQYMDIVNERVLKVKKTIEGLQKQKIYKESFDSFSVKEVREVPEDVAANWIDQLTIKQFNEELKDVFPYIYNLVNETNQVQELSPEHFTEDDAYFDYGKMAKDIEARFGDTIAMDDIEDWVQENVDDPHMIEMDELAGEIENLGVDIHHSDDYEGQPSSYDEYQDLYGGDDWDHGQFEDFESWADNTVDSALDEGYMKGYKKYHCKDCQDTMHMPTTTCSHDSHDESGSWWRDENGNGVPDIIEGVKTPGDSHYNKERAMDMLKKKGITNPTYGELMAAIKQIEMGEDTDEGNAFAHAVRKAKMDGKKKGDEIEGPDGEKITIETVTDFVLSMYDRHTGQFPKGETAVLTAVEKDFGENFINPAKDFIEGINSRYAKVMTPQPEEPSELGDILQLSGQKY